MVFLMSRSAMRNITFLFLVLVWSIASCKPDPMPKPDDKNTSKQYSYWVVNEDSFSTNEVTIAIGKAESGMGNNQSNRENNFSISFNIGYKLPVSGYFNLAKEQTQDPDIVGIGFNYNKVWYIPSLYSNSLLTASSVNNKARYALPPTWFVNYYNHNDSVLIHGVFNEP